MQFNALKSVELALKQLQKDEISTIYLPWSVLNIFYTTATERIYTWIFEAQSGRSKGC